MTARLTTALVGTARRADAASFAAAIAAELLLAATFPVALLAIAATPLHGMRLFKALAASGAAAVRVVSALTAATFIAAVRTASAVRTYGSPAAVLAPPAITITASSSAEGVVHLNLALFVAATGHAALSGSQERASHPS